MRRGISGVWWAGAVWLAAASAVARADPLPSGAVEAPRTDTAGPIRLQMKEVEIRGEVERPEVFYIIPRKEARLELSPLSRDFRDEIMEPLLPGPFEERVKGRRR